MSVDPWTVYWQGDHLQSCIASASSEDGEAIAVFWRDMAAKLDDGATVLDLACGNGVIPKLLLASNGSLKISAVDKAAIAPEKFLSELGELAKVKFLPQIDICELPFESQTFDAVTSQFGLEYASLEGACVEAARVLKKGGVIRLLLHHERSEILRPVMAHLAEIARLLGEDGVVAGVEFYVEKRIELEALEAIGKHYLEAEAMKSRQFSGQVFAAINAIIEQMASDELLARQSLENLQARLRAEQSRLKQLSAAALTEARCDEISQALERSGVRIDAFEPLTIAGSDPDATPLEILIGWQLTGSKQHS